MTTISTALADLVRARMDQATGGGPGEVRLIFHGPPLDLLGQVYEAVAPHAAAAGVPLVLQVPALPAGVANPDIGASGPCDENHLLNLRNSPAKPTFVALVPPGEHNNRSVKTAADEFGMSATVHSGNVAFEDWWADEFLQELLSLALAGATPDAAEREEARTLARMAAGAADEIDRDRTQRSGAWHLVARLFAAGERNTAEGASRVALALGVPPTGDGKLSAREQKSVLEKIADAMSDGFGPGVARAQENGSDEDAVDLSDFLAHLKASCDRPTGFERAPSAYYAPWSDAALDDPPPWWRRLTTEKWGELLAAEASGVGDIEMACTNALLPPSKGSPVIVERGVELEFQIRGANASNATVTIERTPAGPSGRILGQVASDSGNSFADPVPPPHRSPMRYVASAAGFKPGAIKVVSLETWAPGIIVACRLATKSAPPKKGKTKSGPEYETGLHLPGAGRYELLVFAGPQVEVEDSADASSDEAAQRGESATPVPVRRVRGSQHQLELEVDGNAQVDVHFSRLAADGTPSRETCRVFLTVEEVEQHGCRSEFERLIRANRRSIQPSDARALVQLDRNARASSLEEWMLAEENVAQSYLPIVLAEDYVEAWVQPQWGVTPGPCFSRGRFIKDPRPSPAEFQPPPGFVEARTEIARRIRGEGDQSGLVESAEVGKWVRDEPAFRDAIERYVSTYQLWLSTEPDVACWVDVVAVTSLENDGHTLGRIPDAILLSPLHPARIGWHAAAQQVLLEADQLGRPCPAASVLDPDCVPDLLQLSLRGPSGIERLEFVSVENGTDYWSVLWNGRQLRSLPERSTRAPFGAAFGISVGGISAGFSAAQVGRALEDVTDLLAAKPVVGVAVASAGGTTDGCNDGLISWCGRRYQEDDGRPVRQAVGPRLLEIYDDRVEASRPDEATIANLCEDTRNSVRWFVELPPGSSPDLGIIAQLEMSEPATTEVATRTPIGHGALIRHRIRRQLPDAFLCESRQGRPPAPVEDSLAEKVGACVAALENLGQQRTGMSFAPNVNTIQHMFEVRRTDYVAVSSSAIDPACFLGGWLKGACLWDYDLPSYSHRAGDTNGYYLLSRVKEADRESLGKALSNLPGCRDLDEGLVRNVLLEVARRGIPTIRGLASGNAGATGDLGLFLAVRLLQDRFRVEGNADSLLQVLEGTEDDARIAIIVPVDPFRGYLGDLTRALRSERKDSTLSRPDLMVIGMRIAGERVQLHLTPVEVKCRPGSAFPQSEASDALAQAKSLSALLSAMLPDPGQPRLWAVAFQHLLLSILGFGMRVYSQHEDVVDQERWSRFHERIAASILAEECDVTVDARGRLLVVDDSPRSRPRDHDSDGFDETIVIGLEDAGHMVAGDPAAYYASVRDKVADWGLLPSAEGARRGVAPMDEAAEFTSAPVEANLAPQPPSPVDPEPASEPPASPSHAPTDPPAAASPLGPARADAWPSRGIRLDIGATVDGFQPRELGLNISDTRLNHMNMGVVGDLGTGKTQLLKSLITQIARSGPDNRGIRPRFLIFDYKRDYSSADFVEATGARVVRPHRLPINLFDTSSMSETTAPWLHRYRFFADVLEKIYPGIGPVQRDKLKRAVKGAYEAAPHGRPPTLNDVHATYQEITEGKADSPSAIIGDLIDMEVFASNPAETMPFNDFLDGVVVISLDALGQDDHSKNMLVAVMLNLFYENMLLTPKRPFLGADPQLRAIDSYLLVDEADNIMRYEFDVLRKLLLQGREFGTGIILASQYLRHFKVNATDYRDPLLTWFIHKVPNVTPAELGALGLTGSVAELAERVKSLQNHQCLYKSFDVSGEVVRGLPFFELVQRPPVR
jgi:DNA phosphorothioation-dependent restriction protein DptH